MDEYDQINNFSDVQLMDSVTEIVSAYVSNNQMDKSELSTFIEEVCGTMKSINFSSSFLDSAHRDPAVPIDESVKEDYIVCLEDGKKLKMLKRHLKSSYNMTPEQYRERWSLPVDYPMVAPSYAARRSKLAKDIGLGTKRRKKENISIAA